MKKQLILLLVVSAASNIDAAATGRFGPAARGAFASSRQTFQSALPRGVSNIAKQTATFRTSAPKNINITQSTVVQPFARPTYFGQFKNWFNNNRAALVTGVAALGGGAATYDWFKNQAAVSAEEEILDREDRDEKELNEIKKKLNENQQWTTIFTIRRESDSFQDKLGWQLQDPKYGYGSIKPKVLFDEIYQRIKNINASNSSKDVIVPEIFRETLRQIALQAPIDSRQEFLGYLNNALQDKDTSLIAQKMKVFFDEINPKSAETVRQILNSKGGYPDSINASKLAKIKELIAKTRDRDVIDFLVRDRAKIFGQKRANPTSSTGYWTEAYMAYAYHELNHGKSLLEVLFTGQELPPQKEGLYFVQWDDKLIMPYFRRIVDSDKQVTTDMKKDRKEFFEKVKNNEATPNSIYNLWGYWK